MYTQNLQATNFDQIAETCAILAELLQTAKITTPQAYDAALRALEALEMAVEQYEAVL